MSYSLWLSLTLIASLIGVLLHQSNTVDEGVEEQCCYRTYSSSYQHCQAAEDGDSQVRILCSSLTNSSTRIKTPPATNDCSPGSVPSCAHFARARLACPAACRSCDSRRLQVHEPWDTRAPCRRIRGGSWRGAGRGVCGGRPCDRKSGLCSRP